MKKIDVSVEGGDVVVSAYGVVIRISREERRESTKEGRALDLSALDQVYNDWIEEIIAGELSPSKRPGKRFISTHCRPLIGAINPQEMDLIFIAWIEKGIQQGVLKMNEDYKPGRAKYLVCEQCT